MIETTRLLLRPWKDEDLAPFAAMNTDPRVREFFPTLLTAEQSNADALRFEQQLQKEGFGLFAAELQATQAFIGFIGMQTMHFAIPSLPQPAIEIGWRLAAPYWGLGLATEGAQAILQHAFKIVGVEQVVSITVPANTRSRRVMERIGMRHIPELTFNHPRVPTNHPLSTHVLYSISKPARSSWKPINTGETQQHRKCSRVPLESVPLTRTPLRDRKQGCPISRF